jgi:hypothetical protein
MDSPFEISGRNRSSGVKGADGADPHIKDKQGKTALDQAQDYPYIRAALEKAGAKR